MNKKWSDWEEAFASAIAAEFGSGQRMAAVLYLIKIWNADFVLLQESHTQYWKKREGDRATNKAEHAL